MAVMDAKIGEISDAALGVRLAAAGYATNAGSTGSGNVVLATSPTLVTPTLGVAAATSVNKVTLTAPATGSTLTIADGKTLTASNTVTLTGTDSSSYNLDSIPSKGRIASDVAITSNATLANLTGLSVNVAAGMTYSFSAYLYTTSNASGGIKIAIGGTATATAITYDALITDSGTTTQAARQTALGGAAGVTAVTAALCRIYGTITVNAAGTLTVQGAQNASNASASTFLRGSSFRVEQF
jgi:hypothetical protein